MVSIQASVARAPDATAPDTVDREKEFFTTWLRLMERQNDSFGFTQGLQKLLDQPKDMTSIVQDAKHQANMMNANAKTSMELVKRLNEFFFQDIVPALKRAKETETAGSSQQQDSLDRYLELGDEEEAMPQEFVDDMSGWAAPQEKNHQKTRRDEEGSEDNQESDDEIRGEMFHDMLISNGLKLTAMQAPDYATVMQAQEQATATPNMVTQARMNVSSSAVTDRGKVIANRRGRVAPQIVTNLSPRPGSAGSTQSRSTGEGDDTKVRIGKRAAVNLIAEHVLDVRQFGSAREYYIRWKGVSSPLWISRRKAPLQAKQLIDDYLSARVSASPRQGVVEQTRGGSSKGKKKTSRNGSSVRQGQQHAATVNNIQAPGGEFYTVDHIVNHRLYYNRRQYLVRWENYDESDDTWENADKLRDDVPDIVDAYEQQLQRDVGRAEALQSAMSELSRHGTTGSKSATKKRAIDKVGTKDAVNKRTTHVLASGSRIDGDRSKEKRRRIKEGKRKYAGENNDQIALEEAELEEFSDDEFADSLNN